MPKKPGVAGDALSNRHKNQPHCRHFRHWELRKTDRGARGRGWGQWVQKHGREPEKRRNTYETQKHVEAVLDPGCS